MQNAVLAVGTAPFDIAAKIDDVVAQVTTGGLVALGVVVVWKCYRVAKRLIAGA